MLSPGAPEHAASDIGEWQILRSSMRGLLAACRTEVRENECGRIAMYGIERLS